jgi:hypothetical protein
MTGSDAYKKPSTQQGLPNVSSFPTASPRQGGLCHLDDFLCTAVPARQYFCPVYHSYHPSPHSDSLSGFFYIDSHKIRCLLWSASNINEQDRQGMKLKGKVRTVTKLNAHVPSKRKEEI